jgi:hypothetical protein
MISATDHSFDCCSLTMTSLCSCTLSVTDRDRCILLNEQGPTELVRLSVDASRLARGSCIFLSQSSTLLSFAGTIEVERLKTVSSFCPSQPPYFLDSRPSSSICFSVLLIFIVPAEADVPDLAVTAPYMCISSHAKVP